TITKKMDGTQTAAVVIGCVDLSANLKFFKEQLGFHVELVKPADNPSTVVISGYGVRLHLSKSADQLPHVLFINCQDPIAMGHGKTTLVAPNGTCVELHSLTADVVVPPLQPSLQVRLPSSGAWVVGRAGMRYRDLLPGRYGGRFIASHINIAEPGPVADYVHYHRIRFQFIYCRRGWVRVVYEDQGEPFVMNEGDCVLQPPQIRHRVLESSAQMEVIEMACPAEHETIADHTLSLPNLQVLRPDRLFDGQRFVRHVAKDAAWKPWHVPNVVVRDTGIASATNGIVSTQVMRADKAGTVLVNAAHDKELQLMFVLSGSVTLSALDQTHTIEEDGCFTVPAGVENNVRTLVDGTEVLCVTSPL
ncbi:hypothetical protein EMCRGX_G012615, partial [Ephydatia muelleri]